MDGLNIHTLFFILAAIFLSVFAIVFFWLSLFRKKLLLERLSKNPVLRPVPEHWWESEAVFNPAALVHDNRVHLFYRAMGTDGISRIGHASSPDGIHFDERSIEPIYDHGPGFTPTRTPLTTHTLSYDTLNNGSGGGWGGTEDPRAVSIDDRVYMSFGIFDSWQSMRLAVTSLLHTDFNVRMWAWTPRLVMSPEGQTNKNWVLFPQKINGKFAVLHALTPTVMIEYVDDLADLHEKPIQSNNRRSGRPGHWDALIRGAGAPPILTDRGWLLLYHGTDPERNTGYQVGVMLLDKNNPTKILYQSAEPILSPTEWYENEWKAGVVYASGACVFRGDLLVYYGGGDKYVAAAKMNIDKFLKGLMSHKHVVLERVEL